MSLDLPSVVCFRVTRYCNARCGFCLAPPDGAHPDAETLTQRIDWLLGHGVRTIHFCGGEPTIHPALPRLLAYVGERGARSKLTTNGIVISAALPPLLRELRTQVKVSLHGDQAHHDKMLGRDAFEQTTANLRRLVSANVATSVQTTVVAGGTWVVDWVAAHCLALGVRRLSLLPFIPRGSGREHRGEYELSPRERQVLREQVATKRRALLGRLDVRYLDFNARPIHVAEADGKLILEGASESMDQVLCQIPSTPPTNPRRHSPVWRGLTLAKQS